MRKNMVALCTATAAAAALLAVAGASPAAATRGAAPTECTGALGAVTVAGVVVPDGATCSLNGTKVNGSVTVGANAAFDAADIVVMGNLTATGTGAVIVTKGAVLGKVKLTDVGQFGAADLVVAGALTASGNASVYGERLAVGGNLEVSEISGLILTQSAVGGSLKAKSVYYGTQVCGSVVAKKLAVTASGSSVQVGGGAECAGNLVLDDIVLDDNLSPVVVGGNTVVDDLTCSRNAVAPTGSGNTVHGAKLDQCAAL